MRTLIVDDSQVAIREITQHAPPGMELEVARSYDEAKEAIDTGDYTSYLLDLIGVGGEKLLGDIERVQPNGVNTVLFHSNYIDDGQAHKLMSRPHVLDIIRKPFPGDIINTLLKKIGSYESEAMSGDIGSRIDALYLDDSEVFRELYAESCNALKCGVLATNSVESAVDFLNEKKPSILIFDPSCKAHKTILDYTEQLPWKPVLAAVSRRMNQDTWRYSQGIGALTFARKTRNTDFIKLRLEKLINFVHKIPK